MLGVANVLDVDFLPLYGLDKDWILDLAPVSADTVDLIYLWGMPAVSEARQSFTVSFWSMFFFFYLYQAGSYLT